MKEYKVQQTYTAKENTIIDMISISDYTEKSAKSAWINLGGWQSWNPCYEIPPGQKQPKLSIPVKPTMYHLMTFPGTKFKVSKKQVLTQFVTYLRWNDFYLVFVSCGNINDTLPPVQFVINRSNNTVLVELCDIGKNWIKYETCCKLEIFTANSYFEVKDKLKEIFNNGHLSKLDFLKNPILGWESWYNHYTHINEKLILDDLESLKSTRNILNLTHKNQPIIFQIDDGWEKLVGDWRIDEKRFPSGLASVVNQINEKNYIPGLWMAPFLTYLHTPVAVEHPDWILRDEKGKPIGVGDNAGWYKETPYYCYDLSNDEVIEYLDSLMETVINEWGFQYIKLDFMYAGMVNGNFKNKGAAYQWYNRAIKTLTKRLKTNSGKDVAYLGCGIPMENSFNNFPLTRVGCDTLEKWRNPVLKIVGFKAGPDAFVNLKDTIGRAMWDQTIFANDPDVLFVRNENCSLTRDEKLTIAQVDFMFGSQLMYSDDPATSCSEKEIALATEMAVFMERYKNEEFGIQPLGNDVYRVFTRSGKVTGILDLYHEHKLIIT